MADAFIRCFIAVSLPNNAKQYLTDLQRKIKKKHVKASWSHHERFHITLAFIREIALDRISAMQMALDEATLNQSGLQLAIGPLGFFPNRNKARVLWCGIEDDKNGMKQIHANLCNGLGRMGVQLPRKKFVPHITLARFRHPPQRGCIENLLSSNADLTSPVFHVKAIDLYQSVLHSKGAVHKKLYTSKLK